MNIYVGNINYHVDENELKNEFENYGTVTSVKIIIDKYTGQSKGFGFVEMEDKTEAETAIAELNGKELKGRAIKVNEAKPRE